MESAMIQKMHESRNANDMSSDDDDETMSASATTALTQQQPAVVSPACPRNTSSTLQQLTALLPPPLELPPFLECRRVTGLVIVPPEDSGHQPDPLDLAWNASLPKLDVNMSEETEASAEKKESKPSEAAPPLPKKSPTNFRNHSHHSIPPLLQRRASLNGNILQVTDNQTKHNLFLQRKMGQTSLGASIRVAFRLKQSNSSEAAACGGNMGIEWDVVTSGQKLLQQNSEAPVLAHGCNNNHVYPFEMVSLKCLSSRAVASFGPVQTELAVLHYVHQYYTNHSPETKRRMVESAELLCSDKHNVYAVCPFHGEGTLFQYVSEQGRLTESVARHYFLQILEGLKQLRGMGLYHRNLTAESILLRKADCTISDLSTCLRIASWQDKNGGNNDKSPPLLPPTLALGTHPRILPPEVISTQSFDGYQADLWAAGLILCHMVAGHLPFDWASREDATFYQMCVEGRDALEKENDSTFSMAKTLMSPECLDLILGMLREDPKQRFTLQQIMQHPWLQMETELPSFCQV